MADQELQILIKAVDEVSSTVKQIQGSVEGLGKTSQDTNNKLSSSFDSVQGAMLNLGQVAQGVHNVFETYENSVRRLENVEDRLENSQIRVAQATQALSDAHQKLIDIQRSGERDSLTLERAQISLEKAQNDLTQTVKRYGKDSLESRDAALRLKEAQADLNDAQNLGNKRLQELAKAQQELQDKTDAVTIANNNLDRSQRQLNKTQDDAKWAYVDMGVQLVSVAGNLSTLFKNIGPLVSAEGIPALSGSFSSLGLTLGTGAIGVGVIGAFMLMQELWNTSNTKKAQDEIKKIDDILKVLTTSANETDQAIGKILAEESKLKAMKDAGYFSTGTHSTSTDYNSPKLTNVPTITIPGAPSKITVHDGIIKPNGQVIQTDPRDTLVAMKDVDKSVSNLAGGGIIITVEGNNIYGTDPDDIAEALFKKIRRKISIAQ